MLVKPGTTFIAPHEGARGEAFQYVDSVSFVTLDYGCCYVLVLDPGLTAFPIGSVQLFSWKPEHWVERGWTMFEI